MESRSVSRVLSRTVIPLRQPSLTASSNLPGPSAGHARGSLFGLAPSGVYLATDCYQPCGALLPHLFTLTGTEALRRLFSVALSVGSRLPGVTWHFALWSPDFPPSLLAGTKRDSDCPIDSPPTRVTTQAASCKLQAGSWKLEAGSWKLEAGSWKLEAGSQRASQRLTPGKLFLPASSL